MIKKRSIGLAVFLYIITLGIYPLVMFCIMGNEINKICEGDGKKQMHYLLALLLGIVTLGIYPEVWCYKQMERLCDNAYRYGPTVHPANSGSSYLLWRYLGLFLAVAIGPIVAFCKFLGNVNAFAGVAGNIQPLPYTDNQIERVYIAEHNDVTPESFHQNKQSISVSAIPQNNVQGLPAETAVDHVPKTSAAPGHAPGGMNSGTITGISGMYSGFVFPVLDNETMTIGTNPQLSSIVIDNNGKFVSSKHCSVCYNAVNNYYDVTDFSTNGTYTNDNVRIQKNTSKRFGPGAIIYLGNRENSFKLG